MKNIPNFDVSFGLWDKPIQDRCHLWGSTLRQRLDFRVLYDPQPASASLVGFRTTFHGNNRVYWKLQFT